VERAAGRQDLRDVFGEETVKAGKAVMLASGACVLAAFVFLRPLRFFENVFYDFNFALRSSSPSDSVVIVGIDPASISEVGAWPWPRSTIARCIEKIEAGAPSALAVDILFPPRPESKPGNDSLAAALCKVKKLVLPFRAGITSSNAPAPVIPPVLSLHRFLVLSRQDRLAGLSLFKADRIDASDATFSACASRSGFINVTTSSSSQKLRHLVQVIKIGDDYFPSFSLSAAAAFLDCKPDQFFLDGGAKVVVKDKQVPISPYAGTTLLHFRGRAGSIKTVSAAGVLNDVIDMTIFRNRLVFFGVTDAATGADFFTTPVGSQFPGVEVWANAALDILQNAWIREHDAVADAANVIYAFLLFPGLFLVIPGRKKALLAGGTIVLVLLSIVTGFFLFPKVLYFWNPAYHLCAGLLTISVLAGQKNILFTDAASLDFSIPQDLDKDLDATPPPREQDFMQTIPDAESSLWVAKQIRIAPVGRPPQPLGETLAEAVIESGPSFSGQPQWPDIRRPEGRTSPTLGALSTEQQARFAELCGGRIIRVIGSGGMADVYLVWNPRLEVYRAVKVLKPDQSSLFQARFETEIRVLSKLLHPHIVQFYGVGEWHGLPYIEMEYVPGASMDDVYRKCTVLTAQEAMAVGIAVCRALHYAHTQATTLYGKTYRGVIHRDLKPANIMVSKSGRVKLADFGIARPGEVSLHTLDIGKVVGTLPYLAPEQLDGSDITAASDIYALGATLYEFVSGERAFPQTDINALVTAKAGGRVKPLPSHTPPGLVNIINRATALHANDRYATAQSMEKDLEKTLRPLLAPGKPVFGIFKDMVNRYSV
jgi:eukaryotic-like serine/threonine-protein kinase